MLVNYCDYCHEPPGCCLCYDLDPDTDEEMEAIVAEQMANPPDWWRSDCRQGNGPRPPYQTKYRIPAKVPARRELT